MAGFFNPLWLLALALLPLVRWLHRWHAPLSSWPVAAIFIWRETSADAAAGETKRKPDPAWRRRAVIVALLVIALAGPYRQSELSDLTVWIDDSLSMYSTENDTTRLALGMNALALELSEETSGPDRVSLRSLTNPGRSQLLHDRRRIAVPDWPPSPSDRTSAGAGTTMDLPPPALLSTDSIHWLVTDSASDAVRQWATRAALARIIQVGKNTENAGVFRLAAGRNLQQSDQVDVLVGVVNQGLRTISRDLQLHDGNRLLGHKPLLLEPGQETYLRFQVPIAPETAALRARMSPPDTLSADDELGLDIRPLQPLPTRLGKNCGEALYRAIDTHPALMLTGKVRPELTIECMTSTAPAGLPVAPADPAPVVSTLPAWLPVAGSAQDISLQKPWIAVTGGSRILFTAAQTETHAPDQKQDTATFDSRLQPALAGADQVLLRAGEVPLVVRRITGEDRPVVVETNIDMTRPAFTRQPEFAAFVAALVDLTVGHHLLEETVSTARNPEASIIAPASIPPGEKHQAMPVAGKTAGSLSTLFLIAALLLLAADTILLWRAQQGAHRA